MKDHVTRMTGQVINRTQIVRDNDGDADIGKGQQGQLGKRQYG